MPPSLAPLIAAGPVVFSHAVAAMLAFALCLVQFACPKGTRAHRIVGWTGLAALAFVAVSSFWIHDMRLVGPFGPIHLLSIYVLFSLWHAIRAARRGQIQSHRRTMISLFSFGLVVAGAFTLLPGRVMHEVVFGG